MQSPASDGKVRGAFSRRSPVRPIPIAASIVALVRVGSDGLIVRGMDYVDGTPLLDIEPDRHSSNRMSAFTDADDKTKRSQPDRSKTNMNEDYEVKYRSKELGVTRAELQRAVDKVGNSAAAVRKQLAS